MSDVLIFRQHDRDWLLGLPTAKTARKTARIVAVQVWTDFQVETDRGLMEGKTGDWLVTNHPDDDGGSDVWSISDERMKATYEVVS